MTTSMAAALSSASSSATAGPSRSAEGAVGGGAGSSFDNANDSDGSFDVVAAYHQHLAASSDLPMPIAAILALCDMVACSDAGTTSELMITIRHGCDRLRSQLANPVPAQAGMDLFQRFVVTKNWEEGISESSSSSRRRSSGVAVSYRDEFTAHKQSLIALAREFAAHTAPSCRERITELATPFIRDDAVGRAREGAPLCTTSMESSLLTQPLAPTYR